MMDGRLNTLEVDRRFAVDTSFVLFFLALDTGQSGISLGFDLSLSVLTLSALVVLPYFLPSPGEKPEFQRWVMGRTAIAIFGLILGAIFHQALGVVFPELFRFFPMTLLILTAAVSCCLQFCAMIRFRLAR